MEPEVRQLKIAHEIDSLEEVKNKLVKCHHRLSQCNRLYKQYSELKMHWKERDKRYQNLKRDKVELNRINRKLEEEKRDLEDSLRVGMAKLSSTAGNLGALQKRYTLLKSACKRYVPPEQLPSSPASGRRGSPRVSRHSRSLRRSPSLRSLIF